MLHFAMHDTPITIVEYVAEDGHNPFREWLAGPRDREAAARVRVRLVRCRVSSGSSFPGSARSA
jgi:putative component of toxin-antitoxin plasmid stabilization module